MLENGQMQNLAVGSPAKNILARIFYEKTRLRPDMLMEKAMLGSDRCLVSRDPAKLSKITKSDVYLVGGAHIFQVNPDCSFSVQTSFLERKLLDFFLAG